jgi:hypothetical protein
MSRLSVLTRRQQHELRPPTEEDLATVGKFRRRFGVLALVGLSVALVGAFGPWRHFEKEQTFTYGSGSSRVSEQLLVGNGYRWGPLVQPWFLIVLALVLVGLYFAKRGLAGHRASVAWSACAGAVAFVVACVVVISYMVARYHVAASQQAEVRFYALTRGIGVGLYAVVVGVGFSLLMLRSMYREGFYYWRKPPKKTRRYPGRWQ